MASHGPGHLLMKRGKRGAAAIIQSDVIAGARCHLEFLVDILLNPANAIDEFEMIDWCKWLMAGGQTPEEFANTVRSYDNASTCGLVWTANFVAYRCRTCGISPCMSLCAECFQRGDHEGHDFNMFRSQAGGACDCGDTSVMKESGFCERHGFKTDERKPAPPNELMAVSEAVMPRIILRLIQHLREHSKSSSAEALTQAIAEADPFLSMLHDLSAMGAAMRRTMTSALTNQQIYRQLTDHLVSPQSPEMAAYMEESQRLYKEALKSLPNPEPIPEHKDIFALQEMLTHVTFLEELVFWTVKFEFPQKIVCLLLNMLPDQEYKEALTQAFVLHYSRISQMLENSSDPDTLSNRVVHVSVQLFSNEALAVHMVDKYSLLHVMVTSLKYMMTKILIPNSLHDSYQNFHYVVDCARPVMKEHCYWPLVSDLNNVLSHHPVAVRFMSDESLLETWFKFLSMFQGMNVNVRELIQHVEFEPNTYYAAFSAELEASAYPMWALLSHLRSPDTVHLTRKVLAHTINALQDWFDSINMTQISIVYTNQVSFHLPLHRYLAVFMCQAVNNQGLPLSEVLPPIGLLHLIMIHPLRVQVAFYEILNGLWVRNGLQIKGQAMTYIQCNFCNSMVDADLYLLQVCATILPPHTFMKTVLFRFHVLEWLSFSGHGEGSSAIGSGASNVGGGSSGGHLDSGQDSDAPMLESCLTFLASLISLRTNLGGDMNKLSELELVTLLCMGDKTHSQLMELVPERCGTVTSPRDFDTVLGLVAEYRAPNLEASGAMQQGMYSPKPHVWLKVYDPIHVLLRAVHRRDFQSSMDRYNQYLSSSGRMSSGVSAWPPYREPEPCHSSYSDPRRILKSKVFHAMAWIVLYKSLTQHTVTEHVISLVVYLLEMAIAITLADTGDNKDSQVCQVESCRERKVSDGDLDNWFESDWLSSNLRTVISTIALKPPLDITFDSDSDDEWAETRQNNLAIGGEVDDPLGLEYPLAVYHSTPLKGSKKSTGGGRYSLMAGNEVVVVGGGGSIVVAGSATSDESGASSQPNSAPLALPTSDTQMVVAGRSTSGSGVSGSGASSRNRTRPLKSIYPPPYKKILEPRESIISLLLKLHSALAGTPDSFDPESQPTPIADDYTESVGDGPHFVGKLLRKIMSLDEDCKDAVIRTRESLWPRQSDETERRQAEAKQKEERRRKAKERQQKLMEEFASRQKLFMERQAMETEEQDKMEWSEDGSGCSGSQPGKPAVVEYDCVICNQSSPSTEDKPMGLAVLVQATSVLGARRKGPPPPLPTTDRERAALRTSDTMAATFDQRVENFDRHFPRGSWALCVSIGWESGVHVQTCGHHLHLDCLKSYLMSLRTQQRLAAERGEYACPLCRQLANSVLPLPQTPPPPPTEKMPSPQVAVAEMLNDGPAFQQYAPSQTRTNLVDAMIKSLEDMINSTFPKFRRKLASYGPEVTMMFVSSIARTNLEIEIMQRGGSLTTTQPPLLSTSSGSLMTPLAGTSAASSSTSIASSSSSAPPNVLLVPKRSCINALMPVLRQHSWQIWPTVMKPMWEVWAALLPQEVLPLPQKGWMNPLLPVVPLLLSDPSALLTRFVLMLPLHHDIANFTAVVKALYNLLYYEVAVQISLSLTPSERGSLAAGGACTSIESALAMIVSALDQAGLYSTGTTSISNSDQQPMPSHVESCSSSSMLPSSAITLDGVPEGISLEEKVRLLCLPYLRLASLVRHHLFAQPLPEIEDPQQEFVQLVYYLELVQEGMDKDRFNAGIVVSPNWEQVVGSWLWSLTKFVSSAEAPARSLLSSQHTLWNQPRLLALPTLYDRIFQFYHRRQCSQCHSVPRETSLCLLCGALICLKENCCKQLNMCEAVQHSIECGAGTAVYLVVTSSYIIVVRGKRACLWGSVYLDTFGEEDRELKRGKPLYLSNSRYELLQQQWLAHRFDHTNKKWVWHRDAL